MVFAYIERALNRLVIAFKEKFQSLFELFNALKRESWPEPQKEYYRELLYRGNSPIEAHEFASLAMKKAKGDIEQVFGYKSLGEVIYPSLAREDVNKDTRSQLSTLINKVYSSSMVGDWNISASLTGYYSKDQKKQLQDITNVRPYQLIPFLRLLEKDRLKVLYNDQSYDLDKSAVYKMIELILGGFSYSEALNKIMP